jgi:misacylated tRNA(Ala) deacylase
MPPLVGSRAIQVCLRSRDAAARSRRRSGRPTRRPSRTWRLPVTGGQIGADEGRLDFDISDPSGVDKESLTRALNDLVAANHPVSERWITDAELEANPHLVRTMSVKPPMGSGKVRLVVIGEDGKVDLQPCGGTHVRATGEIGTLAVAKIENKGKQNRRIRVVFA